MQYMEMKGSLKIVRRVAQKMMVKAPIQNVNLSFFLSFFFFLPSFLSSYLSIFLSFFLFLLFSFLILRLDSSKLHDFHDGFHTKQQDFSLSSAPAHHFFTTWQSHAHGSSTSRWRIIASFAMLFSSLLHMLRKHLAMKHNYSRSMGQNYGLVCMETEWGFVGVSLVSDCSASTAYISVIER